MSGPSRPSTSEIAQLAAVVEAVLGRADRGSSTSSLSPTAPRASPGVGDREVDAGEEREPSLPAERSDAPAQFPAASARMDTPYATARNFGGSGEQVFTLTLSLTLSLSLSHTHTLSLSVPLFVSLVAMHDSLRCGALCCWVRQVLFRGVGRFPPLFSFPALFERIFFVSRLV